MLQISTGDLHKYCTQVHNARCGPTRKGHFGLLRKEFGSRRGSTRVPVWEGLEHSCFYYGQALVRDTVWSVCTIIYVTVIDRQSDMHALVSPGQSQRADDDRKAAATWPAGRLCLYQAGSPAGTLDASLASTTLLANLDRTSAPPSPTRHDPVCWTLLPP